VGVGWLVSSLAEAAVLVWRTRRHISLDVFRHLALPAALGALAAVVGWAAASHLGPTLVATVVGAIVAALIYGAGMIVLRRALVADAIALGRRSVTSLGR